MAAVVDNEEYWRRVEERAAQLGSDGCTHVLEWNHRCCLEHDIHCRTGMTLGGHPITRQEADFVFWACNRARAWSRLSWYDPFSWWRYYGVRLGAFLASRRP